MNAEIARLKREIHFEEELVLQLTDKLIEKYTRLLELQQNERCEQVTSK